MSRLTSDNFKPRNEIVERAFYSVVNASYKDPRKVCKYLIKRWTSHGYKNTSISVNHIELETSDEPIGGTQQFLSNMMTAMPESKWGDNFTLFVTRNSPCQAL